MENITEKLNDLTNIARRLQEDVNALLLVTLAKAKTIDEEIGFIELDKNKPICVEFTACGLIYGGIIKGVEYLDYGAGIFYRLLATNNEYYTQPIHNVKFKCVENKLAIIEQIAKYILQNEEK